MAAAASDTGLRERTFEHTWEIKDWKKVVKNETLIENTTTKIRLEADNLLFATVLIGTSVERTYVGFYWQLLSTHCNVDDAKIYLVSDVLNSSGNVNATYKTQASTVIGNTIPIIKSYWGLSSNGTLYADHCNSAGSLVIRLKFTLKNLPERHYLSGKEFEKIFKDEVTRNLGALLGDKSNSDIKIITKDNDEVFAHKTILCAQCPIFALMFGSVYLESSTGVVKVDNISVKTMNILLHYWYTGELLPTWRDEDIVAEFVYAAGKYQMTLVLNMLDNVIAWEFGPSDADTELLKMTQQLSLKTAESKTLEGLVRKISQAASGTELLGLFYQGTDIIDENSFSALQILKALDNAMSDNDEKVASPEDVRMMALACKVGMQNVENKLLKRIIRTVSKVNTSDDLFALFDTQKGGNVYVAGESVDLLERVSP